MSPIEGSMGPKEDSEAHINLKILKELLEVNPEIFGDRIDYAKWLTSQAEGDMFLNSGSEISPLIAGHLASLCAQYSKIAG